MEMRTAGRAGIEASAVGLGVWQLGSDWGDVDPADADAVLDAAVDAGVRFIDTADVYGDGRSETFVGQLLRRRPDAGVFVATKMGRRADQVPENYSAANFRAWTDRSRANLGVDTLDLVQLHCPPTEVLEDESVYDDLDALVADGTIARYGVSVETCAQAMTAIAHPNVAAIQIIFNCFRQKPLDEVLPAAAEAGVAIIARVPLASGLLSGKYDAHTTFAAGDHRTYNRHGEAFDIGETFAGVPFEVGLKAVADLRPIIGDGVPMAAFALRWIIDQPGVTTVIPGARNADQARGNAAAADVPPLTAGQRAGVQEVYDRLLRPHVGDRW